MLGVTCPSSQRTNGFRPVFMHYDGGRCWLSTNRDVSDHVEAALRLDNVWLEGKGSLTSACDSLGVDHVAPFYEQCALHVSGCHGSANLLSLLFILLRCRRIGA